MRETRGPAAGGFPEESTASSRSSGTPHAPAAEFTLIAKLRIRLSGCESAPTMKRVALGLRGAKRTTPRKAPVHVAAPTVKPLKYSFRLPRAKSGLGS